MRNQDFSQRPSSSSDAELNPFDLSQRLAYLNLSATDAEQVRRLLPLFEEYADRFVENFYAHLFAFVSTARFLRDPEVVARLKKQQKDHLTSMLAADWNDSYVRQRTRVGDTHAEIGVNPELFLGAYNQYVQDCVRYFARVESPETQAFLEQVLALIKVIFLDVGLTLDAYFRRSTHSLQSALDMFWRANTELRQFAQLASHDLKTPLATVANLCEEVLDEFGAEMPEAAREMISMAKQRTYRMSTMVEELLSLTTAPETADTQEAVDTSLALDEAVDRLRPLMTEQNIQFSRDAELPIVWGNRVRLREAFYNLLSNAVKFIDKRPGTIEITSQLRDDRAIITIADNGPGIPGDEIDRIFSPFRRLPTHRNMPGSGLGLYFTKNLVEQQGGRVWAESQLGSGSRFSVELRTARTAWQGNSI